MAWNNKGSIRGPQGVQGIQGPQGPAGAAAPKMAGSLVWASGWFDPPADRFTRLGGTYSGNGRLTVNYDVGGCTSVTAYTATLVAPVTGLYLLTAAQTWIQGSKIKGCGLGTSQTDGASGVKLWVDSNDSNFGTVARTTRLTAGTQLHAWTWNTAGTAMSPDYRGMLAEYSITLLQEL
ncbi:minor tail protein [Corynebacterium phage EmiRose]|uniref:Minor tail protein n=1 Tax=Corynebacterium phage EmiRose TaxID=2565372 RepID=A0A649VPA6_9CAUD|nr:minor tail protein [Corynebacterium phage EmiRose]QGJ94158.1 minor tail protein [Corynebacterium phage EmiRose]